MLFSLSTRYQVNIKRIVGGLSTAAGMILFLLFTYHSAIRNEKAEYVGIVEKVSCQSRKHGGAFAVAIRLENGEIKSFSKESMSCGRYHGVTAGRKIKLTQTISNEVVESMAVEGRVILTERESFWAGFIGLIILEGIFIFLAIECFRSSHEGSTNRKKYRG